MFSTYIGNGVAIPHGIDVESQHILKPGIAIAQYPRGIDFGNGEIAYLLIAVVDLRFDCNIVTVMDTINLSDVLFPIYRGRDVFFSCIKI